jgi:hypothetical protein
MAVKTDQRLAFFFLTFGAIAAAGFFFDPIQGATAKTIPRPAATLANRSNVSRAWSEASLCVRERAS